MYVGHYPRVEARAETVAGLAGEDMIVSPGDGYQNILILVEVVLRMVFFEGGTGVVALRCFFSVTFRCLSI